MNVTYKLPKRCGIVLDKMHSDFATKYWISVGKQWENSGHVQLSSGLFADKGGGGGGQRYNVGDIVGN